MFAFDLQLGLFFCKKGTLGPSRTTWSEPHHLLFRAKKEDIRRFHGVILVFSFSNLLSIPTQIIQESMRGTIILFGSGNTSIATTNTRNTTNTKMIFTYFTLFRLESFDQQRNHESKQNMLGSFFHVKNGIFFQAQMSKPPNHPQHTNVPLENHQHMIHTRVTYHVGLTFMMPAPRLNFCDVWKKVFFFFFISRFMIFPCNIVEDIRNWRCDRVEDGIDIPH